MTRGIVIFGVNNEHVDYVQIAIMAAAFVKRHMIGYNICLITDKASVEHGRAYDVNDFFTDIVLIPEDNLELFENKRSYKDTQYHAVSSRFRNESRSLAYDLSPYDETLLIDSDYLICNNIFNTVWGCAEDIMINKSAIGLMHNELGGEEFRLNPFGIKMYWATAIYFRKGPKAKTLFGLVAHIKDNWDFYKLTYDFPNSLFRNDYAFSIAIHILNGFLENDDYVVPLPSDNILTAMDTDQFFGILKHDELCFFAQDLSETWRFNAVTTKGLNVHCMNKISLINHMDQIMEKLND
jgi:hypothetical protein